MSVSATTGPRHRADRRPSTPLTELTSQLGAVSRRSTIAAVAATSSAVGLIAAPAATAADGGLTLASVDTSAVTSAAKAQLATAPVVMSPLEAEWTADTVEVTATKPAAPAPRATTTRAASTGTSTAARGGPVPASVSGNAVLEIAAKYIGTPYRSGGSSPAGFDCSGFVKYVYGQLGVSLPHSSRSIRNVGTVVSASEARPGDIIWTPGHVSIYAGGNQMIDASTPGTTVQFRKMWQSNPVFIRV
ncbi:MAG: NlpC/P60 family protein [Micrococcales bacterium]|nr:NlpC/P60 family protein [Micrococcales bacterium]